MNRKNRDWTWIYWSGVVLLVITGYIVWDYFEPEWKDYQDDFKELVASRLDSAGQTGAGGHPAGLGATTGTCRPLHHLPHGRILEGFRERAGTFPHALPRDSGKTSHRAIRLYSVPWRPGAGHRRAVGARHDGRSLGRPGPGRRPCKTYPVKNREALLQINCNQCHRYDRETKGADDINYAKQLVQQKGCRACHTINGRGGMVGPNLTYVGDQSPEQYDYSRMNGVKSAFAWHVAHFKDPKALVSTTVMPNFGFSSTEAQALAMLVLSWKKDHSPGGIHPGRQAGRRPDSRRARQGKADDDGRRRILCEQACFVCHSVSTLGIESATKIGPDLANAVADVQRDSDEHWKIF